MSGELETAAADSLPQLVGKRPKHVPAPGAVCANCETPLHGQWCSNCGQDSDTHKRSILHLAWEAIEGLLHLDGRLLRTLPDLFLRPGRLARDYMEGRIVRHVPPFRTFLVALLIFIFAAEHATHESNRDQQRKAEEHAAALATPQGRATEAARQRADAAKDRDDDLKEAAKDRADEYKDPDDRPARIEARYAGRLAKVHNRYLIALDQADRVAKGLPPETVTEAAVHAGVPTPKVKRAQWWSEGLRKAKANPEYYLTVMFAWGHRMAVLLLPILGFSLAAVYRNKRQYFIYDHLLVAMNLLSFSFLINAAALVLPSPAVLYALAIAALWTPINLFQTLRGAYGSSILGATLKTAIVWWVTIIASVTLLVALLAFSLAQL